MADLSGRFGGRASSNADLDARRRDEPDAASQRKPGLRFAAAKNRLAQFQPATVRALCSIARRPAAPVDLQFQQHYRADDAGRWKNPVCLNPTAGDHRTPSPARRCSRSTTMARKSPPSPVRKIPPPPSSSRGCSPMAASSFWFQNPAPVRRDLSAWPGHFKAARRCFPM